MFSSIYTHNLTHSRIFTRIDLLRRKMSFTPETTVESSAAKPDQTSAERVKIARRYRELARDISNRISMVKDNDCLSALILFLHDENKTIVQTSLETLSLLAQNPINKVSMKSQDKLVFCLNNIISSYLSDYDTQVMAQKVMDSINYSARLSLRRRSSYGGGFISQNSRARTVVLQFTSLDETNKSLVEKQLLEMKGIISFTFNMSQQRCKIRIVEDVTGKELCRYLYKTLNFDTQQVVKNEEGEILLSYLTDPYDTVGLNAPEYIPEDVNHPILDRKTVARLDDSQQPTFWGKLGTFISSSLYW